MKIVRQKPIYPGFKKSLSHENIENNFARHFIKNGIYLLLSCHRSMTDFCQLPFFISIYRMSSFLNGPKTIVESKTISLYMCRGNRILILNCKKTTTKGSSTSIFKSDCIVLVSTILSILSWIPPK